MTTYANDTIDLADLDVRPRGGSKVHFGNLGSNYVAQTVIGLDASDEPVTVTVSTILHGRRDYPQTILFLPSSSRPTYDPEHSHADMIEAMRFHVALVDALRNPNVTTTAQAVAVFESLEGEDAE